MLNRSYVYEYDTAGNILAKEEYLFTEETLGTCQSRKVYTYGNAQWGDQLTNYDDQRIFYDGIGNPTRVEYYDSIEDRYASGYDLIWHGRELMQYRAFEDDGEGTVSYGTTISYTYNADGIRTSKTVNGVTHEYYLNGSQIVAEVWTVSGVEHTLIYLYDENGSPIGLKYRTNAYEDEVFDSFFFEKNLQGDIVAIYNQNGTKIGQYQYDAWGNHKRTLVSGITSLERSIVNTYNPFRYRGYYYDVETGWYYLQSRYYNPTWGRFLNADIYISTGQGLLGNNMYAYCNNNPIMYVDSEGELAILIGIGVALLGAGLGACVGATINHSKRNKQLKKIDQEIRGEYTQDQAEAEIKEILSNYIEEPIVKFRREEFYIDNSYKVTNSYDRLKICEIVRRTGVTKRSAKSMAAEWAFHNASYHVACVFNDYSMMESAESANIDYVKDKSTGVRWSTKVFEIFGWN